MMSRITDTRRRARAALAVARTKVPGVYRYPVFAESNILDWELHVLPMAGRPLSYLEIGVCEGGSACWILENVLTHPDSVAILIDPWEQRPSIRRGKVAGAKREREQVARNLAPYTGKMTIIQATSAEAVTHAAVNAQYFDVIYIDGDHSYEGCLADSVAYWPKLKCGGLMIWDDVNEPVSDRMDVLRAVQHFRTMPGIYADEVWRSASMGVRKVSL